MKNLRTLPLLLILCSFTFPAKEVKLQYTFAVGDTYDFTQTSKQSIKQTVPGAGEVTTDVTMSGLMNLKVMELTPKGAKIEARYAKLKIETKGSMMNIIMDSEHTGDDMPSKITKSMMNKTFTFELTKNGVVENVEGADNLYSDLNTLGMDEPTLANTKQAFQQTISEKTLKATLETGLMNYPVEKIKTGDRWKSTSTMAISFPMQVDNTWNLMNVEGPTAFIESDATITTPDKDKVSTLPNGIKSKVNLNGRQALKGKTDVKSGWPTEIKVLSEIKGSMTLLAGSMVPADMEVPMEIVSESTYTIVKK